MISVLRTQLMTSSEIDTVEPYLREDTDLPVIVYEVGDDEPERDLQQGSTLRQTFVTLHCYAGTYSAADDLAEAVEEVLLDWSDVGEKISAAERVAIRRAYALPIESSNQILYEAAVELVVHWNTSE